jgi:hypothetical protein
VCPLGCSLRTYIFLSAIAFAACSEKQLPPVPLHSQAGPAFGELRWWSSPDVQIESLDKGAQEWGQALGCGIVPLRVNAYKDAQVVFSSGQVDEIWSDPDVGYFKVNLPTISSSKTVVILDEWNKKDLARGQVLHIWGHALGYVHVCSGRPSVMDSVPINPIDFAAASEGIRGDELESLTRWAMTNGAPGCEQKSL